MGMWKTLRVSHIPTPPATTTNNCPTRRYTNIPLGTKDRSGQRNGRTRRWAIGRRHRTPSCRSNRGMGMWKKLRVSHIPTPPATTTNNCPTRRYTNIPLGTKDRSGQLQLGVLGFGLLQDWDAWIGVFPEGAEILVGGERPLPAKSSTAG